MESKTVILLNAFLKKDNKQYKRELLRAATIMKDLEEQNDEETE